MINSANMGHRGLGMRKRISQWGLGDGIPLTEDPENPIKPFASYEEGDPDNWSRPDGRLTAPREPRVGNRKPSRTK